jgi:hypothetical protein
VSLSEVFARIWAQAWGHRHLELPVYTIIQAPIKGPIFAREVLAKVFARIRAPGARLKLDVTVTAGARPALPAGGASRF